MEIKNLKKAHDAYIKILELQEEKQTLEAITKLYINHWSLKFSHAEVLDLTDPYIKSGINELLKNRIKNIIEEIDDILKEFDNREKIEYIDAGDI